MNKYMEQAMAGSDAADDAAKDEILAQVQQHRMLFANGPPGTGKTFVIHTQIRKWKDRGARILFALPTGQLASDMRTKHPDIDVDTFHAAFLFHRNLSEAMAILTQYDLVILDEISMLTASQFERLVIMWKSAEKLPCLVLLGDFWQLPIVDKKDKRCELSSAWNGNVRIINFYEQVRCKDKRLQRKLNTLRTSVPSKKNYRKILNNHRAWTTAQPSGFHILQLFRRTKHKTTILTCTRKGSALVNRLAVKVLFEDRHKHCIGNIPIEYESNPQNYDKSKLLEGAPEPARTNIYAGMRIFLTKNLDKEHSFVNGMLAFIQGYNAEAKCLDVITRTQVRLAVHLHTEYVENHGRVTCFPIRVGYASTVQKAQGSTLDHVTIWLDAPGCRAAAYVALSRVRTDDDYLIAGAVQPGHFAPAQ